MIQIKKWFKNNIIIVLCAVAIFGCIFYGFYGYINDYYGYDYSIEVEFYERDLERCNSGEIEIKDYCDNLVYPLTPLESFKLLDAKTLFFNVCYYYVDSFFVMLFPLIVMIIFLSIYHKDFRSGFIRNIFIRESLKKYKSEINMNILKISFIVSLSIFLIFIISCALTRFNFIVDPSVYELGLYTKWNYDNMLLYLIISYFIYVFLCIYYCNIACCFINKNKNIFIVIIISYICWFVIVFLVNCLPIVINLPSFLIRYFNILDYWNLRDYLSRCWYGFVISAMFFAIASFFVREALLRNKEKVIVENEKEII